MAALWTALALTTWVDYALWAVGLVCVVLLTVGVRWARRALMPRAFWLAILVVALIILALGGPLVLR